MLYLSECDSFMLPRILKAVLLACILGPINSDYRLRFGREDWTSLPSRTDTSLQCAKAF